MKLHEIEWTDGKEYLITNYKPSPIKVVVKSGDLYRQTYDRKLDISSELQLKELVEFEFTEIVKPVTFLEAYQDCLVNGNQYINEYNNCKLKRGKTSKQVELHCLWSMDRVSAILIGEVTWTKVVE